MINLKLKGKGHIKHFNDLPALHLFPKGSGYVLQGTYNIEFPYYFHQNIWGAC